MPAIRLPHVLLATAAAVALVAGPATAADEPEFVERKVYFSCAGQTTKVGQVNLLIDDLPGWDDTAPDASVQSGAGCGSADVGLFSGADQGSLYDVTWEGTFTGNLRDLVVEPHFILPTGDVFAPSYEVRLAVDGEEVVLNEQFIADAYLVPSESGASYSTRFAIKNLNLIDDPMGPGTEEHTLTLTLSSHYFDTGFATAFVWDTTEVPAGITFNPPSTKGLASVTAS